MANMSYCRFENTANDLEDCFSTITDDYDSDVKSAFNDDDLSQSEKESLVKILNMASELCEMMGDKPNKSFVLIGELESSLRKSD